MIHSSGVVQVCVLPLWLVLVSVTGSGFILDTDLQAMFVAGVVYSLVDLYGAMVMDALHVVRSHKEDAHQGLSLKSPKTGVTLYAIVIQLILVVFINMQILEQSDSVASSSDSEHDIRVSMNTMGIILLNIYFVLNVIEKTTRLFSSARTGATQMMSGNVFETADELLLFSFVTLTFLYGLILMAMLSTSAKNSFMRIDHDMKDFSATKAGDLLELKMLWSGSWTRTS